MSVKITDVVKKFKGEAGEDIELWLDRFKIAIDLTSTAADDATKKKEMTRLVPLFLESAAYATWKQLSATERVS